MMHIRSALVFALLLPALPVAAQSQPKAVVELFTSQGCASCPPADALLTELAKDPQVIALTMPVDYWDYIGWKDTLALHGHSVRQKAYADRRADHKVFTPQAVVDGVHAVKGSDRAALQRAIIGDPSGGRALRIAIKAERKGDVLEIEIPESTALQEAAELWACPVASSKTVTIDRGENSGRDAMYSNVVRGWVRIGHWNGRRQHHEIKVSDLNIAESDRADIDRIAILLQAGSSAAPGPILGAALVSFP